MSTPAVVVDPNAYQPTPVESDAQRFWTDTRAFEVTERAGLATAEAAVPAPIGTMRATAVFPVEF